MILLCAPRPSAPGNRYRGQDSTQIAVSTQSGPRGRDLRTILQFCSAASVGLEAVCHPKWWPAPWPSLAERTRRVPHFALSSAPAAPHARPACGIASATLTEALIRPVDGLWRFWSEPDGAVAYAGPLCPTVAGVLMTARCTTAVTSPNRGRVPLPAWRDSHRLEVFYVHRGWRGRLGAVLLSCSHWSRNGVSP